eukprot:scaffold498_cov291-Prasinococcus_capsulatus_cf.AAC.2
MPMPSSRALMRQGQRARLTMSTVAFGLNVKCARASSFVHRILNSLAASSRAWTVAVPSGPPAAAGPAPLSQWLGRTLVAAHDIVKVLVRDPLHDEVFEGLGHVLRDHRLGSRGVLEVNVCLQGAVEGAALGVDLPAEMPCFRIHVLLL